MWETIQVLINGLPEWYLMVLVPALIATGIWVFTHLKRDKQGKLYWFSKAYEQRKHTKKLDLVLASIGEHGASIKVLEENVNRFSKDNSAVQMFILKSTIANEQLPDEERMLAYDEYKRRGGNSWVDAYWEAQLPAIRARMDARLGGYHGVERRKGGERRIG
jgi:hypothetical protein